MRKVYVHLSAEVSRMKCTQCQESSFPRESIPFKVRRLQATQTGPWEKNSFFLGTLWNFVALPLSADLDRFL